MEAYYTNALALTMLRREQERIGAKQWAIESRQGVLDAGLDDWQEVMDSALRLSTRCVTAYRRNCERTRRLFNAAVLNEVHVPDGHVVEAAYKEPFDLLFAVPGAESNFPWERNHRTALSWCGFRSQSAPSSL